MDVMLDSNVILADIRFEKTGFAELLDYARRKGDRVIIPQIAFEEIKARYRERLESTVSSLGNMRQLLFVGRDKFPHIDIDAEMQALENHLNKPDKKVSILIYKTDAGIKAFDVAYRGIHRKRPANDNGEELRDVMIWLTALDYAKQSRRPLAFISKNKKAFQESKNSDVLHHELLEECKSAKVDIHFYCDVLPFIQDHSLEQAPIKETEVPEVIKFENLDSQSAMSVRNIRTPFGYPSEIHIEEIKFTDGTMFKISEATSVAEYHFRGNARLIVSGWLQHGETSIDSATFKHLQQTLTFVDIHQAGLSQTPSPVVNLTAQIPGLIQVRYGFDMEISARFRNGQLASWELESFRYTRELEPPDGN